MICPLQKFLPYLPLACIIHANEFTSLEVLECWNIINSLCAENFKYGDMKDFHMMEILELEMPPK